jgi:hypothetical protein
VYLSSVLHSSGFHPKDWQQNISQSTSNPAPAVPSGLRLRRKKFRDEQQNFNGAGILQRHVATQPRNDHGARTTERRGKVRGRYRREAETDESPSSCVVAVRPTAVSGLPCIQETPSPAAYQAAVSRSRCRQRSC